MNCVTCGDEIEFVKVRPFRWAYVHIALGESDHQAEPAAEGRAS